jgi:hypothetical protein
MGFPAFETLLHPVLSALCFLPQLVPDQVLLSNAATALLHAPYIQPRLCSCLLLSPPHLTSPPPAVVRKGYHLLAVSLFLPALLLEPQLLAVALAAAFALLLALEVLRLSGLPVVGGWVLVWGVAACLLVCVSRFLPATPIGCAGAAL